MHDIAPFMHQGKVSHLFYTGRVRIDYYNNNNKALEHTVSSPSPLAPPWARSSASQTCGESTVPFSCPMTVVMGGVQRDSTLAVRGLKKKTLDRESCHKRRLLPRTKDRGRGKQKQIMGFGGVRPKTCLCWRGCRGAVAAAVRFCSTIFSRLLSNSQPSGRRHPPSCSSSSSSIGGSTTRAVKYVGGSFSGELWRHAGSNQHQNASSGKT